MEAQVAWLARQNEELLQILKHLIQKSIQTDIQRSRRIKTTPLVVEATKKKAKVIDEMTTKVTTVIGFFEKRINSSSLETHIPTTSTGRSNSFIFQVHGRLLSSRHGL